MRTLAGKPLFVHSVEVAKSCDGIDDVVVSSDSDEILEVAQKYGATCIKRPLDLCGDDVPNYVVCQHVVDELDSTGKSVEKIVLLQPTNPFRDSFMLEDAVHKLAADDKYDSLVSIVRVQRSIGVVNSDGEWFSRGISQNIRAQNIDDLCAISGHVFILRVERTLRQGKLLGERIYGWELPESWRDVDIDTFNDFQVAKCVASQYFKSQS